MIGQMFGPYRILEKLAEGGMGEVYKARDTRLDRTVAIKVLPPDVSADPERRARFEREARTIADLSHPHVCAIHDVGDHDGAIFLVMEHVEGETLADRLLRGPLPLDQAIAIATEVADALAAAHRHGVIHRDLKPANVMVTADGHVKVLDFGLAKHVGPHLDVASEVTTALLPAHERGLTGAGVVVGTVPYMSPEQVEGVPLDARSDIFSFGALFYELLTGQKAFRGDSPISTLSAILRDTPLDARHVRPDVPRAVEAILDRCLEKKRDLRYASGVELHRHLAACQSQLAAQNLGLRALLGKPRFAVPALAALALLLGAVSWFLWRSSRQNWARTVAVPEIERLLDTGRSCAAFRLVGRAEKYLPGDPELQRIRQAFMRRASFLSDPPGVDVYVRDYLDTAAEAPWDYLGRTPLEAVLIPAGHLRYRMTKPGLQAVEGYSASAVTGAVGDVEVKLDPEGSTPPGMVRVPAQKPLEEFWLDKYEVTNRQFKAFIARGGYQKSDWWKEPFVKGATTIGWGQATADFKDATGRPGPATWEFGTFPEGHDDYPVGGVSWHEAAAYCESEGKSLPTVRHWQGAALLGMFATILEASNFSGRGPARVGSFGGLGPFGTYDAAGNVREWCSNASGDKRYVLGGAWDDPKYMFYLPDARPAFDRSSGNGFRCAKYPRPPSRDLTGPVAPLVGTPPGEGPASDAVFEVFRRIHCYDRGELDAKVEATDDSAPYWREQKVSFRAAYGNERVTAYLFLPKNADPPFQTVVTFPGNYAFDIRSSARLETQWFDYIIRSGRVVVHPIYNGTYERTLGGNYSTYISQSSVWRELAIQWHKDLGRSLDYLETRPEFDREKFAYQGISMGALQGPRLMALEPRLKVGLLLWGGFGYRASPEVSPFNFASRCTVPTLMINGRFDMIFPLETSQLPMYRQLGAAEKEHFLVDNAGHVAFNQEVIRRSLGWLDKYLGPVKTR